MLFSTRSSPPAADDTSGSAAFIAPILYIYLSKTLTRKQQQMQQQMQLLTNWPGRWEWPPDPDWAGRTLGYFPIRKALCTHTATTTHSHIHSQSNKPRTGTFISLANKPTLDCLDSRTDQKTSRINHTLLGHLVSSAMQAATMTPMTMMTATAADVFMLLIPISHTSSSSSASRNCSKCHHCTRSTRILAMEHNPDGKRGSRNTSRFTNNKNNQTKANRTTRRRLKTLELSNSSQHSARAVDDELDDDDDLLCRKEQKQQNTLDSTFGSVRNWFGIVFRMRFSCVPFMMHTVKRPLNSLHFNLSESECQVKLVADWHFRLTVDRLGRGECSVWHLL